MGVLAYYKRWRHSKGFGIHSPFAYRFITEVLCQPLPYYSYSRIGSDKDLRLLVRLLAFFRPERIMIMSRNPGRYTAIIKTVAPQSEIVDCDADFIVADIAADIEKPVNALLIGRDTIERAAELRCRYSYGMAFSNDSSRAVFAALPHLPRQDFSLRF
jgi:hypothetical protein